MFINELLATLELYKGILIEENLPFVWVDRAKFEIKGDILYLKPPEDFKILDDYKNKNGWIEVSIIKVQSKRD